MENKIWDIIEECRVGKITTNEATDKVLILYNVSGSNCCKQCKEPIEKGFRFCSGECKQYYYR